MRKIVASLIIFMSIISGTIQPANASNDESQKIVCASTAICFSRTSTTLPFDAYQGTIARGVCHNLTIADATGFIDNNTGTQWRVFVNSGCTGTMGTIFSHSEGPMLPPYLNTINSIYRTATLEP